MIIINAKLNQEINSNLELKISNVYSKTIVMNANNVSIYFKVVFDHNKM